MNKFVLHLLLLLSAGLNVFGAGVHASSLDQDRHSAVILAYYSIGDAESSDADLPLDQFLAHVEEIKKEGYLVIGLASLIDAFRTGREIPEKTLVITFQGAFQSAYKNAMPVLIREKIPFTVFYSTAQAAGASNGMLRWSDLENLSRNPLITLGILSDSAGDAANPNAENLKRQINSSVAAHRRHFGQGPDFLGYAHGGPGLPFRSIVEEAGFEAALGLQSGAAYGGGDLYKLPRFTMSGSYGDLDRFRLVTAALPFPVFDEEPADGFIKNNAPLGFTVPKALEKDLSSLNCFIAGAEKPDLEILGTRVELRGYGASGEDRVRVNCTLPSRISSDQGPRWRWFGMLLVRAS